VTVTCDAGNAGTFAFHCHHFHRMAAGIIDLIPYDGISERGRGENVPRLPAMRARGISWRR
jgi:hypothetical protein